MVVLGSLGRLEFILVDLEKLLGLRWVGTRYVVEGVGRDVVRLAFSHERVVFEKILLLRCIAFGLCFEHLFGCRSGIRARGRCVRNNAYARGEKGLQRETKSKYTEWKHVRRNLVIFQIDSKCLAGRGRQFVAVAELRAYVCIKVLLERDLCTRARRLHVLRASSLPVRTINWPRCLSLRPCSPFPVRTCAATLATSYSPPVG